MTPEKLSLVIDGSGDGRQPPGDVIGDDGIKVARLPRWTRQEILVLIQGKKVAENRVKRGRLSGFGFGSAQPEPKWASVASYCKRHGVNRGPVQCRKRWSNLAGDFKKIKEWESKSREETESFWLMRNDLRRERKLPGFFDKEVYDILDSGGRCADAAGEEGVAGELSLTLATAPCTIEGGEEVDAEEALFDSGRSAAADEGLFSDFEPSGKEDSFRGYGPIKETSPLPTSMSEKHHQSFQQESSDQVNETQAASKAEVKGAHEGKKRKLFASDGVEEDPLAQHQLIEALEKNRKLMCLQLEAQNTNLQLDREQRKEHANSLITVLNKLADALGRIAEFREYQQRVLLSHFETFLCAVIWHFHMKNNGDSLGFVLSVIFYSAGIMHYIVVCSSF